MFYRIVFIDSMEMEEKRNWKFGKFKIVERLVNLNADRKRLWLENLKSMDESKMFSSMPLSMNHYTKIQV